ncbi:HNH endonuclease signature motif containing protein [Streptomyces sp. NPDC014748]|uniref:HNH endonuclease signature motif containing protein n=1 Tax=Streptomyces sp. NPDC014748 TaxID=3364905 RepID=UPI0036FFDE52
MTHAICKVEDCDRPVKRLGWCNMHSARWYRTGSVEDTRINNFTRYEVSGNGCWIWTGPLFQSNGYGQMSRAYKGTNLAYRAFYLKHVGSVPEGLQLDHLCRDRRCVNPQHLEPVTPAENQRRGLMGYGARTLCKAGLHDITDPANWYSPPGNPNARSCYPCAKAKWARQDARRRKTIATN